MLCHNVKHTCNAASNTIVGVLVFVHLDANDAVLEIAHKINFGILLVSIATEAYIDFSFELHPSLCQRLSHLLLPLLPTLLSTLCVNLLVCGDVTSCCGTKITSLEVACIWTLARVASFIDDEVARLCSAVITANKVTHEGFIKRVRSLVCLQPFTKLQPQKAQTYKH